MTNEGAVRVLYVGRGAAAESGAPDAGPGVLADAAGVAVVRAGSAGAAMESLAAGRFDCVVSEYDLPDGDGVELLRSVREAHGELPFVLYTAAWTKAVASEAAAAGVTDQLPKGAGDGDPAVLADRVAAAVDRHRPGRSSRRRERAATARELREILDTVSVGIGLKDTDGRYRLLNEAARRWTPLEADESVRGRTDEELFAPDVAAELRAADRHVLETGEPFEREIEVAADGGGRVFLTRWSPLLDDDGDPTGVCTVATDITARKRRERERRRNERRFEAVFEDPKMLVGLLDADGTLLHANRTAMAYVDADLSALVGEPFPATPWWCGDDVRRDVERWIDRAASGEYVEFEVDLRRSDGEPYSVDGTFRPVTGEDGEVVSLIVSARDVTERKRRERALRESEARYQSLTEDALDTSEVGTIILDESFDVVWINSAIETYFGVDREAVVGRDKRDLLRGELAGVFDHPDDVVETLLAAYRDNTYTEEFECRVRPDEDRLERWLTHWSQPITSGLYEGGRIEHYTDVSDRKERDRQLQVLGRVLRHNFYNEMNVILGNADLIAEDAPPAAVACAETIIETGEELLELTDKQRQIVDLLSRDPVVEPVEVATLVDRRADRLRAAHPEATVSVSTPEAAYGSAIPAFERAVWELLENAVVHSDRASPRVDVAVDVGAETVRLRVADDGPGIPERERAILRGEREISQLYHGRGMGLWLVHWIVTNSGGTLSFSTNDPRGSAVELTLPRVDGGDAPPVSSTGD